MGIILYAADGVTPITGGKTAGLGPLHVTNKPIPADGHYRITHRCALVNAQAANSRLFEIRNPQAGKVLILTRLVTKWINSAGHTAIIEDSLDVFKVTNFSAVDTTNVVSLAASLKRTSMSADVALIRGVTVAGAAAGMTGGTLTKDGSPFAQHPRIFAIVVMAAGDTTPRVADWSEHLDSGEDTHAWTFAQNEGFIVENRVLLGAAAGSSLYIDASYAIVDAANY